MNKKFFLGLGCALFSLNAANVEISEAYARASVPNNKNSAIFLKIKNKANTDINIIAANNDNSSYTELHTHKHENGMMKMVKVDKLLIPANSSLELKPGSDHIMLFDLKEPLKAGTSVKLELKFDDGDTKMIENIIVKELKPMKKMNNK